MNEQISTIVKELDLLPHPEGGYYKETYRSDVQIKQAHLPEKFNGDRNYATAIYFLLTSDNFSAFHRIKQDELWHFYSGSPLYVHVIDKVGNYKRHEVGLELQKGQRPQLLVEKGCWFASSVKESNNYSLVGCTVSPGFDFEDFELAKRAELVKEYPQHASIIEQLTR